MLRIKLVKSLVGHNEKNRRTLKALGLRRPGNVVEHENNSTIQGMIQHVRAHLLVEEVEGTPKKSQRVHKNKTGETSAPVVTAEPEVPVAETAPAPKKTKKAAKPEEN